MVEVSTNEWHGYCIIVSMVLITQRAQILAEMATGPSLSEELTFIKQKRHISDHQLGKELGVPHSYITDWRNGKHECRTRRIIAKIYAAALELKE